MFFVLSVAPGDYAPQMMILLTIPNGETSVTHSIMIVNDMINEEPEFFTATLTGATSTDPDIIFVDDVFPATATVNIVDDDGKELCSILQVFLIKYKLCKFPHGKVLINGQHCRTSLE